MFAADTHAYAPGREHLKIHGGEFGGDCIALLACAGMVAQPEPEQVPEQGHRCVCLDTLSVDVRLRHIVSLVHANEAEQKKRSSEKMYEIEELSEQLANKRARRSMCKDKVWAAADRGV